MRREAVARRTQIMGLPGRGSHSFSDEMVAAFRTTGPSIVLGALHPAVASNARCGRILLADQQVMSLRKVHHSYTCDFVSHPNDQAQQPAHAGEGTESRETVSRVAGLL